MFGDKVQKLEKEISKLLIEISKHKTAKAKAKSEDKWVHSERQAAAEKALKDAQAKLVIARAKESMKNQKKK
jgi:hypothetical protein